MLKLDHKSGSVIQKISCFLGSILVQGKCAPPLPEKKPSGDSALLGFHGWHVAIKPIASMYGVYLPTCTIKINYSCRYIYQSHGWYGKVFVG